MAKLFVEGVVEWLTGFPSLMVSVEDDGGRPVDGLKEDHFTVAEIGSGGGWNQCNVNGLRVEGSSHGFYQVFVDPPALVSAWHPWMADLVFTIEVDSGQDRGQTLAINKCCGDSGLGRER